MCVCAFNIWLRVEYSSAESASRRRAATRTRRPCSWSRADAWWLRCICDRWPRRRSSVDCRHRLPISCSLCRSSRTREHATSRNWSARTASDRLHPLRGCASTTFGRRHRLRRACTPSRLGSSPTRSWSPCSPTRRASGVAWRQWRRQGSANKPWILMTMTFLFEQRVSHVLVLLLNIRRYFKFGVFSRSYWFRVRTSKRCNTCVHIQNWYKNIDIVHSRLEDWNTHITIQIQITTTNNTFVAKYICKKTRSFYPNYWSTLL